MDEDGIKYKSRCDEVILSRAGHPAGVVFDKSMNDEEVMSILQGMIDAKKAPV